MFRRAESSAGRGASGPATTSPPDRSTFVTAPADHNEHAAGAGAGAGAQTQAHGRAHGHVHAHLERPMSTGALPTRMNRPFAVNSSPTRGAVRLEVLAAFELMDKDRSHAVTIDEFVTFMRELGLRTSEQDVRDMFNIIDENHDGTITIEEFVVFMDSLIHSDDSRAWIEDSFRTLDVDGSGAITMEELKQHLLRAGNVDEKEIDELIRFVDRNGDGEIDMREFTALLSGDLLRSPTLASNPGSTESSPSAAMRTNSGVPHTPQELSAFARKLLGPSIKASPPSSPVIE